ncbi:MAG TPA: glycolate oxidase subunit GlcF [Steroidobacteraceae bacterium]|jgi:glycolate oxidase iron-sulfur subunit|nr:glycolate oxidase subunit GlcF [Steroidobacteraceae bacterium]
MQTRFDSAALRDPDTAEAEKVLRKCVHCGFCTATCPTYVLLGDELDSPRGRIYLIKDMLEQERPATASVVRHLDRCLSCLSCMTTCPSGVHYQHLIDHARAYVERTYRRPLPERWLRAALAMILPFPGRLRLALGLAALVPQRLARSGMLPAPLRAMLRLAAVHAATPRAALTLAPNPALPRGRVALLLGCAQGVLTPQTHTASQQLLSRAGWEVVPIAGCCGALTHHLGRDEEQDGFAGRLIENLCTASAAGEFAAIVVNASGCGTQLKDYGFMFRNHPRLAAAAARFSGLARDITEVLALSPLPVQPLPLRPVVAYHSACSMQHGQKLDALPRRLLREAGFELREISEGHLCCGSAGSYNILQPQIALQLRDRKLANIERTGASVVATGNVGCIMQLRSGSPVPVVHTVELLHWACGGPRPAAIPVA